MSNLNTQFTQGPFQTNVDHSLSFAKAALIGKYVVSRSLIYLCVTLPVLMGLSANAHTITVTTAFDDTDVPSSATIADLPGPDGVVSLREALLVSDNEPGRQTIGFAIPEDQRWLPDIFPEFVLLQGSFAFGASDPVTIDGTTQTAFGGDINPDGHEIVVELGVGMDGDGSELFGFHGTHVGLGGNNGVIHDNTGSMRISVGPFNSGCVIRDNEADTIELTYSDDNVVIRNTTERVRITGLNGTDLATGNRIGGPDPADRNFITGFGNYGEHGAPGGDCVELFYTDNTLIQNNYIGTTPDGMAISNPACTTGIAMMSANDNVLVRDNLIAIQSFGIGPYSGVPFGEAMHVQLYEGGTGIEVTGNTFGLNALGEPVLGSLNGIVVSRYAFEFSTQVRIGGPNPGDGNVIAGHLDAGVVMLNGAGVPPIGYIRLSGNSIYANGEIGIDLMPNTWDFGPTANDPLDTDVGANGLQNYPEILTATNNGQAVDVAAQLNSEPFSDYTLEFFASPVCDPSGFGQGQMFLGWTSVFTDSAGNATIDVSLPAVVPSGWVITSTATLEPTGATSEFSACVDITPATEVPVLPEGMKLLDGVEVGRQLSDLYASDDQYLPLDPSPTKNPHKQKVHLIVQSTSTSGFPTDFGFRLESRMLGGPSGDVIQTIELLNYTTGAFELVDTRTVATIDETVQVVTTGDPSRFVQPITNEVTASITWTSDSFSGRPFTWSVDVDEAIWLIEE